LQTFLPGMALNHNPPISTSRVTGIAGMSHCTWQNSHFLIQQILIDIHKISLRSSIILKRIKQLWEMVKMVKA
jgi:hypothetical protein